MKRKALFVAALVGLGSIANAQTTQVTNDKGNVVTPEAGDWAIGFNAAPMFNYVGNMFNGSTGNSLNTAFATGNQAIYGKYFTDENTAFRGSLRIMTMSQKMGSMIDTNTATGNAAEYVENSMKASGFGLVLSGGIEKRKGHGRLQGYYGGEVSITFGGTTPNTEYTYGVALDSTTIADNVMQSNTGNSNLDNTALNGRTISSKAGSTFGFGIRGFIGAEYFFAPKISVAAEYGWGLSLQSTSGGETVTENWGVVDPATAPSNYEMTTMTAKSSTFGIDTDNLGGVIRIMFHF